MEGVSMDKSRVEGEEHECVLECVHERYPEEVPFIHTFHIR